MLSQLSPVVSKAPSAFSSWLLALDYLESPSKEVAIVSESVTDATSSKKFRSMLQKTFSPSVVWRIGHPAELSDQESPRLFRGKKLLEGKTAFYVCESGSCKLPTTEPGLALEQVLSNKEWRLTDQDQD